MSCTVFLTHAARRDLEDIDDYISQTDSPRKADYVLDKFAKQFSKLAQFPERGSYPKELQQVGIREYREVFFKPYRIIYRIRADRVYVLLVTDGRRDMQSLLSRRLLRT